MRIVPFLVSVLITIGLIYALNKPWGAKVPMPLGKFLSNLASGKMLNNLIIILAVI
jgi:hypothetical protein